MILVGSLRRSQPCLRVPLTSTPPADDACLSCWSPTSVAPDRHALLGCAGLGRVRASASTGRRGFGASGLRGFGGGGVAVAVVRCVGSAQTGCSELPRSTLWGGGSVTPRDRLQHRAIDAERAVVIALQRYIYSRRGTTLDFSLLDEQCTQHPPYAPTVPTQTRSTSHVEDAEPCDWSATPCRNMSCCPSPSRDPHSH